MAIGYVSKARVLKKYNWDYDNSECKEELKRIEDQNETWILNNMQMDLEVRRALEEYAYQTEIDIVGRKETRFEIDYDRFLESEEFKKLLEKYPKDKLGNCILLSAPLACVNKLMVSRASKGKQWRRCENADIAD